MDEEKELKRLEQVNTIQRDRIEEEIANVDTDIACSMLDLDKVHKTINKLTTARIFLFNQDNALMELEKAEGLENKTEAYNKFMDLFITEQPKCSINELQSLVGYNIVKHWLDNLINEYGEDEEEKDYQTIIGLIDKYYNRFMNS